MGKDRRHKPIVALEWDARTLRVVHAVWRKKQVKIEKVLAVEIGADVDRQDAQQMGRFIGNVLKEQGITTRRAVIDAPRDQAILSTMKLPAGIPQELPSMVQFQIAKELPFAVTDAAVDFAMPEDTKGKGLVPIAVAAVRNEFIAHRQAICQAAGLKIERMGLRPFANKIAVCAMLKDAMPEHFLFVDVGPTLMEVDVISTSSKASAASLDFSRAASVMVPKNLGSGETLKLVGPSQGSIEDAADGSSSQPTLPRVGDSDAVVRELLLEVTRSVEAYRTSAPTAKITHAVIAGDLGVEEALQEAIQNHFHISVDLYNPASTFGWTPDEGEGAAGFPALLGLILGEGVDERLHFDFLHPKQSVTQAQVQLRKAPRLVGWAAFIALAIGILYWANFSQGRRDIRALEQEIVDLSGGKGDKEKFIKLVQRVRGFDERQEIWVDNLYDLMEALPDNKTIVLDRIDMSTEDRTFKLHSRVKTSGDADKIRAGLDDYQRPGAAKHRFDATLTGLQPPKRGEKYPYHQSIPVRLLNDQWTASTGIDKKKDAASKEATGAKPKDNATKEGGTS